MKRRAPNLSNASGDPLPGKACDPLWEAFRGTSEDMLCLETMLGKQGHERIAGLDEAGRGPLAGPVFAAAVILPPGERYEGLTDSKLLRPAARERWDERIRQAAIAWAVTWVGSREIDEINILQASRKAMEMAVRALGIPPPGFLLVDGITPLETRIPQWCVKKGDRRSQSIAAASILAKVSRDRVMEDLHQQYPRYNFRRNKGYGTPEHLEALRRFGGCPEHRTSFRGVLQDGPRTEAPETPSLFGWRGA